MDARQHLTEQARYRAEVHFNQGNCCAPSVLLALGEVFGLRDAQTQALAAEGLCGGISNRRGSCGVATGAALAYGLLGRDGLMAPSQLRQLCAHWSHEFEGMAGALRCEDLLDLKPMLQRKQSYCRELTANGAALAAGLLWDRSGISPVI